MDLNPFEKDILFDFIRTIKRECTKLRELAEKGIKERQKTNNLLKELLKMLDSR